MPPFPPPPSTPPPPPLPPREPSAAASRRPEPGAARLETLARQPAAAQERDGYLHTLRELRQQPETWEVTAAAMVARRDALRACLARAGVSAGGGRGRLLLTGSGSSLFVGECLAPSLQAALGLPVQAVAGGQLLTHPRQWVLPDVPTLVVSFARSGNSPESTAVVDLLARQAPAYQHLVITCNRDGRLATGYGDRPNIQMEVLDERTCDRSLVMTSSFTNMVVAGRALAHLDAPAAHLAETSALARIGRDLLARHGDDLAALAERPFTRVVLLASGGRLGAAREGALKMVEMSEGQTLATAETFLGLRHGPMSAAQDDTLVLGFLSSDAVVRTYELDVLDELRRKRLGQRRVIVGDGLPAMRPGEEVGVELAGLLALEGDEPAPIDAVVVQLLAFFRCLSLGLRPDDPSRGGVIARVVDTFAIHS